MLNTQLIGNKIAEARKKANLSQAQLSQQLFISAQAVGKWERGESMPDIITLIHLAEILSVDLNYFSDGMEPMSKEMTSPEPQAEQPAEMPSAKNKKKPGWDMSRWNWVDADFSGLKNLHAKFSSSNMQRCKFIGSDLSGLLLKNNNVDACEFSGSDISHSHIHGSNLGNNLYKDCSLQETEFSGSNISGCDFSGADFTGASFRGCNFGKNILTKAVWNRTSFTGMAIEDVIFEGKLEDCSFENCAFNKLTFQNATLINTFFKNKNLKRVRFIDCQADRITYEFLKSGKADLTGITLLASS